jgi:hypothetical protein
MSVTQTAFNFVPDISNTGSRVKETSLFASVPRLYVNLSFVKVSVPVNVCGRSNSIKVLSFIITSPGD